MHGESEKVGASFVNRGGKIGELGSRTLLPCACRGTTIRNPSAFEALEMTDILQRIN